MSPPGGIGIPSRPAEAVSYRGGAGEPMVLVHGIGGSWRNFGPVIPALEARHEVLAVGLLGHHPSQPFAPGVRPSVSSLVDGVESAMDRAGLAGAHLVGNSLGGWVVLELAKRGRARSVVALSPGGGFVPGSLVADLTALRLLFEHRVTARLLASRAERWTSRPGLRRLLFTGAFARPDRLAAGEAADLLRSFGGATGFVDLLRAIKHDGPLADLERISAPVMIAWGTRDRVLPLRHFAPILRDGIPGCEFRELPGLGHVPMVDAPELVADLILGFAARHERQRSASAA